MNRLYHPKQFRWINDNLTHIDCFPLVADMVGLYRSGNLYYAGGPEDPNCDYVAFIIKAGLNSSMWAFTTFAVTDKFYLVPPAEICYPPTLSWCDYECIRIAVLNWLSAHEVLEL